MTIQTTTNKIIYVGNGITTSFSYNFAIQSNTWLNIYIDGVLQVLTTNYSVTGVNASSGGNVIFVTAPSASSSVIISRTNIPVTQLIDLRVNDQFPPETIESELDKLTMLLQQVTESNTRSIRLSQSDNTNDSTELSNDPRNDRLVMFDNASGDVKVTDRTYTSITQTLDNISNYIATGSQLSFPLDLGFVSDPVIFYTYDLGGLS